MPLSADLVAKSVQAAVAAIEIYNKPTFAYREEAFSLLMTNAWELLLKAKWLLDHGEAIESLYEMVKYPDGTEVPRQNRSGNPVSRGLLYLARHMAEDKNTGLERPTYDNLLVLTEIRDNAAHLINKDLYIGRRVQEVGTASLRNYLLLSAEWFQLDLSKYNFFLMPISFYHGFEAAEPVSRAEYPEQVQKLLAYIDDLESTDTDNTSAQHVALRLETRLFRGKDVAAIEFRFTNNANAPAIAIREEKVLKNYPMTYEMLTEAMRERYSNFVANQRYHDVRQPLEGDRRFCYPRPLNAKNPGGACQRFYSPNIFQELDGLYIRR